MAREQGRTAQGPTCSRADDPGRGVTVGDERSDDVDGCVCRTNIGTYGRLRGVDDAEEGFGDPVGVGERGRECWCYVGVENNNSSCLDTIR